ncbi:MAG: serine/threonine protein kinase [Rubrivivax sp.]|nr:serine/threonine protein kinase [Rubrivivax sp.]
MSLPVEDLKKLSQLLDTALDLDPAEQEAWLARLEAADDVAARLAPNLRQLLARKGAGETADLIDRGPVFALPEGVASARAAAGDRVGPYVLVRELGVGGMGEVWLAERADGALKRQVALKLPMFSARRGVLVQRFARERDILAALAHPHIARLYDAGLAEDGQPYLALEYVQGEPITTYCKALGLGPRERVALLRQVLEAVQFAHANLVIHRDLKPGNVLVRADGQAMLLDFGIAKLMESEQGQAQETELTRVGGRALTLGYAAPEQIAGAAVSTATDVYALGALLYELLAGVRPFEGKPHEVEAAVLGQEPPRPKGVPADLSNIVLKALKKAPAERYATAEAFAADLRRWLDGAPVLAQPDSMGYRLRKFVARHRVGVAASAAMLAVVLGASVVSLQQARRAEAEAQRAQREALRAQSEAQTARAVQDFLEGIFKASSGDQPSPAKARQRTALALLDEGVARVDQALAGEPRAQLRVFETLAEVYEDMALLERSADLRARAARLTARLDGPGSATHVAALAAQAQALNSSGRNAQARAVLEEADQLLAAQREPDRKARIAVDIAMGDFYNFVDDARGLPYAERAMKLLREQAPSPEWVDALSLLGGLRRVTGDFEGARRALAEAIDVAAKLPGGVASKLPAAYDLWAFAELESGNGERGIELLRKVIEMDEANGGPDSANVFIGRRRLVSALLEEGHAAEALQTVRAMRAKLASLPALKEFVFPVGMQEATALFQLGRIDEGIEAVNRLPDIDGEAARNPMDTFSAWRVTANLRMARSDLEGAADAIARAEGVANGRDLGHGPRLAASLMRSTLALRRGRTDDARALVALVFADTAAPLQRIQGAVLAAQIDLAAGDAARAEATAWQALAVIAGGGPSRRGRAVNEPVLQGVLGRALLAQGRAAEALVPLRAALDGQRALRDLRVSLVLADAHLSLGDALAATGQRQPAREQLEAARAIHQRWTRVPARDAEALRALGRRLASEPAAAPPASRAR